MVPSGAMEKDRMSNADERKGNKIKNEPKWKEERFWSIVKSGVHLGNGQRIVSGGGHELFYYLLL